MNDMYSLYDWTNYTHDTPKVIGIWNTRDVLVRNYFMIVKRDYRTYLAIF